MEKLLHQRKKEIFFSKDNSAPLKLTGFGVAIKLPAPEIVMRNGNAFNFLKFKNYLGLSKKLIGIII